MKYKDKPIVRFAKEVSLPNRVQFTGGGEAINPQDEIRIKLSTIPVGFLRSFTKVMPKPVPPVITTAKAGGSSEDKVKWNDKQYTADSEEWDYLKNIYLIYLIIKDDNNFSWDTKTIDTPASLRLFNEELIASGFSEGDISFLLANALEISNLNLKELDIAKKGF